MKIFGEQIKDSIVVILSQAASVSHIPEAIEQRIGECERLGLPYIEWESKDISEGEKLAEIQEFFDIVENKLKPYQILSLKGLDQKLYNRAREMQEDPNNWTRNIRAERRDEIVEWTRMNVDTYLVKFKTGEEWLQGTSYATAFANAYKRVGQTIGTLSSESDGAKYISIPLYVIYVTFYTLIPLYPIMQTMEEARRLRVPQTKEEMISSDEMDEYFEPIEEAVKPPFEYMMFKARQEESKSMRMTVVQRVSSAPIKETPALSTQPRRKFVAASAAKEY